MSYFTGPFPAKVLQTPLARGRQRGLSLVELMISITLGMVAVAGAISIYLSNRNSYQLVEGAARVQENARFAVEFLGRDLREAGGIVCGGNLVQENVLESTEKAKWWGDWSTGLKGYNGTSDLPAKDFGTAKKDRVSGTDAVVVWNASTADQDYPLRQVTAFNASTNTFTLYFKTRLESSKGYVHTACDDARIATFTFTAAIPKDTDGGSYTLTAAKTLTNPIKPGGFVNRLRASAWYIGVSSNDSSVRSLYRESLGMDSGSPASEAEEVLENVQNMVITYLQGDGNGAPSTAATDYVKADAVSNWANVLAVRVVLTLATPDKVGLSTSGASQVLTQDFPFTVALRRRLR
ncbi:MAG: PilW family protein [Rhodoferax sp.]|nr:PilW family protein [Rhodoferax sp.]